MNTARNTLNHIEETKEAGFGFFRSDRIVWCRTGLGWLLAVHVYPTYAEAVAAFASINKRNATAWMNANHANCANYR